MADVIAGKSHTYDDDVFDMIIDRPARQVEEIRHQVITKELIDVLVEPLPTAFGQHVRAALEGHVGRTWEQAIVAHGTLDAGAGP